MLMKFELPKRYMKQSKGVIYIDPKQIVSVMKDEEDFEDWFNIYLANGNSWTVKGNMEETLKQLKRLSSKDVEKDKSLTEMADDIVGLTQCGSIRSYFDKECPEMCVYDSSKLFNLFACCEEVAYEIEYGRYKAAEGMIDAYLEGLK